MGRHLTPAWVPGQRLVLHPRTTPWDFTLGHSLAQHRVLHPYHCQPVGRYLTAARASVSAGSKLEEHGGRREGPAGATMLMFGNAFLFNRALVGMMEEDWPRLRWVNLPCFTP